MMELVNTEKNMKKRTFSLRYAAWRMIENKGPETNLICPIGSQNNTTFKKD